MRFLQALSRSGSNAMLILNDPVFNARSEQLGALSVRHRIPVIYQNREFRRGGRPDELRPQLDRSLSGHWPVRRPDSQGREARRPAGACKSKVDFINLKTASALGLEFRRTLVALADEVIE